MKKTLCIFLSLIFVLSAAEVFAQEKKAESGWKLDTVGEPYQIGVGDILEIVTWKEPDFTRENVLVRSDGKILSADK